MADHDLSDGDLASLFGLSAEEMAALGMETPAADETAPEPQSSQQTGPRDTPGSPEDDIVPTREGPRIRNPLRRASRIPQTPPLPPPPAVTTEAFQSMTPHEEQALSVGGALPNDAAFAEPPVLDDVAPSASSDQGPSAELTAAFAEESGELLDGFHVELEALERAANDWAALREARRTVHTLKGAAGVCGFTRVVRLSHACESLLDLYVDGETPLAPAALRLLFAAEPVLRQSVDASLGGEVAHLTAAEDAMIASLTAAVGPAPVARPSAPDPIKATTLVAPPAPEVDPSPPSQPASPLPGPESSAERALPPTERRLATTLSVSLDRVDELVNKVTEVLSNRAASQDALSRIVKAATEASALAQRLQGIAALLAAECAVAGLVRSPGDSTMATAPIATASSGTAARIQTLLLQLEEATADESAVLTGLKAGIVNRWALGAAEQRLDAELHMALLGIRLVPLSNLRVRLDQAVRAAATATGKAVSLRLEGGEVAVEKNVFDRIYEPLLHLLRNSVDHGMEPPDVRLLLGKPETGTITINAHDEGTNVVIRVHDDGSGIDPALVAERAVQRGIVTAEAVAAMSASQKQELIFTHGFSTSTAVSDLSGRGLGMDIVREACVRMGGTVEMESTAGQGATFILRLPVTLSLARVLVVRDGTALAALPAGGIRAVHLAKVADVVESPRGTAFRKPRAAAEEGDQVMLPLVTLPLPQDAAAESYVREGELHILEIAHGGQVLGLLIEELMVEEEAVVKPLPAILRPSSLFLGAIILASGEAAPLLNLPEVLRHAHPARLRPGTTARSREDHARALVVDDSLSMRVALTQTLEKAGFQVQTAQDGRQALEAISTHGMPDLVTLDVEMPRMNGMETLYAIRHSPGGADIPIFMISSRAAEHHRQAALDLGATRYFTKPYPPEDLITAARAAGRATTLARS